MLKELYFTKKTNVIFFAFYLYFTLTSIYGVIINYSPVPFWDMWNGYLEFYAHVVNGDYSIWWSQHNEHRILLSRILFWIDIKYFSGTIVFLLVANIIFLSLIALLLCKMVKVGNDSEVCWCYLAITAWMFFWSQNNNLTWGFQSQFFLAYLVPLLSFYSLYRFKDCDKNIYFYGSLLFGYLSIWTMANGVLTMPLLVLFSLLLRLNKSKVSQVVLIATLSLVCFFYKYQVIKAPGHTSLLEALLVYPIDTLKYFFTYVGSPLYYAFSYSKHSITISMIGGMFLFLYFSFIAIRRILTKSYDAHFLMLLISSLYIFGTAFITASGRVSQGLDQAVSSRYTTPALIVWVLCFIFFSSAVIDEKKKKIFTMKIVFIGLLASMSVYQSTALISRNESIFNEKLAALQVALNINDKRQILYTFPSSTWAISIASDDAVKNISIFSDEPYKGVSTYMGKELYINTGYTCLGNIEDVSDFGEYMRVSGWAIDNNKNNTVPKYFYILNEQSRMIGAALSGFYRPDVSSIYGNEYKYSGFVGYVPKEAGTTKINILYNDYTNCIIKLGD